MMRARRTRVSFPLSYRQCAWLADALVARREQLQRDAAESVRDCGHVRAAIIREHARVAGLYSYLDASFDAHLRQLNGMPQRPGTLRTLRAMD